MSNGSTRQRWFEQSVSCSSARHQSTSFEKRPDDLNVKPASSNFFPLIFRIASLIIIEQLQNVLIPTVLIWIILDMRLVREWFSIITLCERHNICTFNHEKKVKLKEMNYHQETSTTVFFLLKMSIDKPVLVTLFLSSLRLTNSLNEIPNCVLIKWLHGALSGY